MAVASVQAFFREGPQELAELLGLGLVCEVAPFHGEDRQACLALRRRALAPT